MAKEGRRGEIKKQAFRRETDEEEGGVARTWQVKEGKLEKAAVLHDTMSAALILQYNHKWPMVSYCLFTGVSKGLL